MCVPKGAAHAQSERDRDFLVSTPCSEPVNTYNAGFHVLPRATLAAMAGARDVLLSCYVPFPPNPMQALK